MDGQLDAVLGIERAFLSMLGDMRDAFAWTSVLPVAGLLLLTLTGCTQDPREATSSACENEAVLGKLRDDTRAPQEVSAKTTSIENRPDSAAYDIEGLTTLSYATGPDTVHEWTCFAQISEGTTYAAVRLWDGVAVLGTTP